MIFSLKKDVLLKVKYRLFTRDWVASDSVASCDEVVDGTAASAVAIGDTDTGDVMLLLFDGSACDVVVSVVLLLLM